jgi:hypothetical protein
VSESHVPWPVAVSFLIRPLGDSFVLADVYALADPLRSAFPQNQHVEAKIRQSLQILRARGRIAFEGHGHYRKLVADIRPSVNLDFAEAANYTSRSQVARVAVEAWAATNVACNRCKSPLLLVPNNSKLLDAVCRKHQHEVQVKGVSGPAPDRLLTAAYGPMAERLVNGTLPDYLIVSYDRLREAVILAEFIDGRTIDHTRLRARTALSQDAKRAGWIGSTIDLNGLCRDVVVGPSLHPEIERWRSPSIVKTISPRMPNNE